MIKEYCDMLFESRAVDKLNKDIKNNPEINFKIIGYNVIPNWEKEIVEDSTTKISIIPESEIATSTDPEVSEFISKRFNIPDNPE